MNFLRTAWVGPLFLSCLLTLNVKSVFAQDNSEDQIERTTLDTAERTIQVPYFEKGKFAGYRDVPLNPDTPARTIQSITAEPEPATLEAPPENPVPKDDPSPIE